MGDFKEFVERTKTWLLAVSFEELKAQGNEAAYQLKELLANNSDREEYIAYLFYVLFNTAPLNPGEHKDANNDLFRGNKTLHIVTVLEGIGDLEHFCKWYDAYCQIKGVNDTTVVISYLHTEHTEEELKNYIQDLPDAHPLKSKQDIIFSMVAANNSSIVHIPSSVSIEGMVLAPIVYGDRIEDSYRAVYAISAIRGTSFLENLSALGLPCCFIHELGAPKELGKNQYMHEFKFGFDPRNKDNLGCLFPDLTVKSNLKDIISNMSEFLQRKLFGQDYAKYSVEEKIDIFNKMDLIVGYYQAGRSVEPIDTLIQSSVAEGSNPFLFLTGYDYANYANLPYRLIDIRTLIIKFMHEKTCRLGSGKLDDHDYKDLLDLVKINFNNKFFCSGDNTILTSIALGKLPVFLHLSMSPSNNKVAALTDFNLNLIWLLKSSQAETTFNVDDKPLGFTEQKLLEEIINGFDARLGGYVKPIGHEASEFFAKRIAPHILKQCCMSQEKLQLLINKIEGDNTSVKLGAKLH